MARKPVLNGFRLLPRLSLAQEDWAGNHVRGNKDDNIPKITGLIDYCFIFLLSSFDLLCHCTAKSGLGIQG